MLSVRHGGSISAILKFKEKARRLKKIAKNEDASLFMMRDQTTMDKMERKIKRKLAEIESNNRRDDSVCSAKERRARLNETFERLKKKELTESFSCFDKKDEIFSIKNSYSNYLCGRCETRGTYRTVSSETSRGIKQNSRYIDALNNILSKYKNIPCYFLSTTANILNKEKMISKK